MRDTTETELPAQTPPWAFADLRVRPRRLRRNEPLRSLVRETRLHPDSLVLPLLLVERDNDRWPVPSMPGVFRTGLAEAKRDMDEAMALGIRSFIFFGIPRHKDASGSEARSETGVVQRALRAARQDYGRDAALFADTCFCQYTSHGHCGSLGRTSYGETWVDNDRTLEILAETAASQASAGADVIVPSGMIDGMVAAIRQGLDRAGFVDTLVCAHSVKMASALYTPFRDAAESAPVEGDRRSLQMDPANAEEAEREAALDESEGADLLLVEPAVACLDIIRRVSVRTRLPVAAFMASGEYAMIKAAGAQGWIDEAAVLWEQHVAIKRAGARVIMTYAAREIAQMIKERG